MKVGDFVRFRSEIIRANSHLALTSDKGVLVRFTDEKHRNAEVVWSDGDHGEFRVKDLAVTKGDMNSAITIPGERRKPLRDFGNGVPRRDTFRNGSSAIVSKTPTPKVIDRRAIWCIAEEREVKGFISKDKEGNERYIPFKVPLTVVEIRATDWPAGTTIKLSRSATSLTVTYPNGEKESKTPTAARIFLSERFRGDIVDTLRGKLRV